MLNHSRTLLLNLPGKPQQDFSLPGEELIPAAFLPLQLPQSCQQVRRVLFGADPDRHFLNYRAWQLLTLLHATPAASWLYKHDPRVSYDLTVSPYFDDTIYRPKVSPQIVASGASSTLSFAGTPPVADNRGQMLWTWDVEILTQTTATSTLRRPSATKLGSYTNTNGISSLIPLAGSRCSFRVQQSSFADNAGPKFVIELLCRPTKGMDELLLSLDALPQEVLRDLFDAGEPDFANLWQKHYGLVYRLSGLLLAYIWRLEAVRATGSV